jgi:hypothetical protein
MPERKAFGNNEHNKTETGLMLHINMYGSEKQK